MTDEQRIQRGLHRIIKKFNTSYVEERREDWPHSKTITGKRAIKVYIKEKYGNGKRTFFVYLPTEESIQRDVAKKQKVVKIQETKFEEIKETVEQVWV